MTYSKIVNPKTGRKVSISGRIGREILKQYLNVLTGGAKLKRELGIRLGKNENEKQWCNDMNKEIDAGRSIADWIANGTAAQQHYADRYLCQCAVRRTSEKERCGTLYRQE
mgnify:FL=1|tara:strand:+ start:15006 stop:15338 length:333 start_codon:yes stop_codon:yes gene_type:complete